MVYLEGTPKIHLQPKLQSECDIHWVYNELSKTTNKSLKCVPPSLEGLICDAFFSYD